MNGRRLRALAALGWAVALVGCSKSSMMDLPDCAYLHACGRTTPAPATEVPPQHRATAQACNPTPDSAMVEYVYGATGRPCASNDQCQDDAGLPGYCIHGACTVDECFTDDDCGAGGVCECSSPSGSSAMVNRNLCVGGNCRVDADCGANGYCSPSSGGCGTNGYYCHTPADTCVDPALDCGTPCLSACTYFSDKKAFACLGPICGGC